MGGGLIIFFLPFFVLIEIIWIFLTKDSKEAPARMRDYAKVHMAFQITRWVGSSYVAPIFKGLTKLIL